MVEPREAENARRILLYCERGLRALQADPGEPWIAIWAGSVMLLRTVGHALTRDAAANPRIRAAQQVWWEEVKRRRGEHRVFWEFVDLNKNDLLHEGILHASQSVRVGITIDYSYLMASGPHAGRDSRELIAEALEWWKRQIDRIERHAAELAS